MRKLAFPVLLVLVLCVALPVLLQADGAESGRWQSPGGTVTIDVEIEDHETLPTVVNVTVSEIIPAGGTHEGIGTGGNEPDTADDFGPITLDSGHGYRIRDGKHEWHNKNWADPDAWQEMKKAPVLPNVPPGGQ